MKKYYFSEFPNAIMDEPFLINDVEMVKLVIDICDTLDTLFVDTTAFEVSKLIERYVADRISNPVISLL